MPFAFQPLCTFDTEGPILLPIHILNIELLKLHLRHLTSRDANLNSFLLNLFVDLIYSNIPCILNPLQPIIQVDDTVKLLFYLKPYFINIFCDLLIVLKRLSLVHAFFDSIQLLNLQETKFVTLLDVLLKILIFLLFYLLCNFLTYLQKPIPSQFPGPLQSLLVVLWIQILPVFVQVFPLLQLYSPCVGGQQLNLKVKLLLRGRLVDKALQLSRVSEH